MEKSGVASGLGSTEKQKAARRATVLQLIAKQVMGGGWGGLSGGVGYSTGLDLWGKSMDLREELMSKECLMDTPSARNHHSLPVTGDPFLRWFSRRGDDHL